MLLLWPSPAVNVRPRLSATLRALPMATRVDAVPLAAPAVIAVPSSPVRSPRVAPGQTPALASAPGRAIERKSLAPVAEATPTADETIDADGLRSYRLALALAARRFRDYPAQAIERGESGTVGLRVAVPAEAGAGRVELLRSSGHAELDGEAQAMLTKALQVTLLPASLRGRAFSFEMPVEFSLPAR